MDTKSRIALFVGGVVLVGFVAYVLLPAKKPAEDTSADTSTQSQTDTSGQLAGAPATQPTAPVAAADPFAAPPATQPSVAAAPTVAVGPAPAPAPAETTDAWARALDGNTSSASVGMGAPSTSTLTSPLAHTGAATGKTYKIASGDSLYSVSEKLYGNGKYVNKLVAANPGLNPKKLKIGQEINVPDLASDTAAPAAAAPTLVHTTPTPAASDKTYKVQTGDTLHKIAAKLYGNAAMWEKLYSANKSLIGSDPSHLKAGMVLQLPEAH